MALGYPDHFAGYVQAGAAYSLNNFIYSNIRYEVMDSTSTIAGEFVDVSLDLENFVPGYLAENNQYVGGQYYSMPYSKSTETMAINRTVVKQHVAAIRAAGIDVSDEGFFSHTTPLTFTQVQTLGTILLNDTATTDVANFQCGYLLNYDSSGNMFINMSRQFGAPYTNSAGEILINNDTTKSMLNYINAMFTSRTFVLPNQFGQLYGSTNFKYGDICMTVGSTAGVLYNIPTSLDVAANLKFGIFDVDFLQVPQPVATSGQTVTLSDGTTNYNFTGSLSSVQQGPNIGIFKNASTNEKLFAWLFIKYITSAENTALWAMDTGYLPVRLSAYTSDVLIQLTPTFSTTYVDFLSIATDYWTADGDVDWAATDERWDYLHSSMVANIAKNQALYYQYDPAFPAGSSSAGSATIRVEAGYCLENIYNKSKTPTQALAFLMNQIDW
jgi:multiple sugar transport system substrate-binding protein